MDKTKIEREKGITMQTTTKQFFTKNYYYSIIVALEPRDFIKNVTSGTAQSDCALLMVPADENM